MAKHGTALTIGQFAEFGGAVLKALPREIDAGVALNWTRNGAALERVLREALVPKAKRENAATAEILRVNLDAYPFVPVGWTIEEHIKGGHIEWVHAKVRLYLSEQQVGKVQGNQLREESKGKPVYNANLLDYLLKNPHLIPEEWKGKWAFFWGTIYRGPDRRLCVRFLYWHGDFWCWAFLWLDDGFDASRPAAVPASNLGLGT